MLQHDEIVYNDLRANYYCITNMSACAWFIICGGFLTNIIFICMFFPPGAVGNPFFLPLDFTLSIMCHIDFISWGRISVFFINFPLCAAAISFPVVGLLFFVAFFGHLVFGFVFI